jgi:hypothetical protein
VVVLLVVFAASAVIAWFIAPANANLGFKDSAAVLAFISLAAVAIERTIEGFFGLMAGRFGQWWPLKAVKVEFDTFEAKTNETLGPVVRQTVDELTAAKDLAGQSKDEVARIQGLIDRVDAEQVRLSARLADATTKLNPGSERLALVGDVNTAMTTFLHGIHTQSATYTTGAQALLATTGEAADRASAIIASFQDNPARRLASLLLGASLGVLVAAGVGLNLFAATLVGPDGSTRDLPQLVAGTFGVVLTGIVIGLGSAPTHEVVKSLQTYKDSRTAPSSVTTMITDMSGFGAVAMGAAAIDPAGGEEAVFGQGATNPTAVLRARAVRRTG